MDVINTLNVKQQIRFFRIDCGAYYSFDCLALLGVADSVLSEEVSNVVSTTLYSCVCHCASV